MLVILVLDLPANGLSH